MELRITKTEHYADHATIELSNGRRVVVDTEGTLAIWDPPENGEQPQPMLIDLADDKIRPL